MWTTEDLEKLEQEQYEMSTEEFALLVAILSVCKRDLKNEILSFFGKYGKNGVVTYVQSRKRVGDGNNRKRVAVLYEVIDEILDTHFLELENEFRKSLIDIIRSEIDFFDIEIDIDEILNVKWGTDNLNWFTRLYNHRDKWSKIVKRDLKLAFIRGDNLEDVLKKLDETFKSAEKALRSLHITEYNAVESEARYRIFKELEYKSYQYFATLDERTCETCGGLHGQVFPMSSFEVGTTAPPIHPRCRCFIVPID